MVLYNNSTADRLLGCLLQNPSLVLDEKYNMGELFRDEFKIKLHMIVYVCIYNLYISGCKTITIFDINEYLSSYEAQYNVYKDNDGDEYIETIIELTDVDNFESYYNEFMKLSCLRYYYENKCDIGKFFDIDKDEQTEMGRLSTYEINDIIDYFENMNLQAQKKYFVKGREIVETYAGDGLREFKEQLQEEPLYGISFNSELLNTVTRGQVDGQISCFSSPSGCGKAQPVNTIIPTPNGNRKLGDIKVGDYVFDRIGKPTKVLGVYPQGIIDCYTIKFQDGRTTKCNGEHLWTYYTDHHSNCDTIKTDTLNNILKLKEKVSIPINNAVEYNNNKLLIDPYVIGSFIGNGCCLEPTLCLSSNDEEQVKFVADILQCKYYKPCDKNYSWKFYTNDLDKIKSRLKTKEILGKYSNELCVHSYEKRIPNEYKYSSIENRYRLLQGLMDTDGHIQNGGRFNISYSTSSYNLAQDVVEILHSLGYCCSIRVDSRNQQRPNYIVIINVSNSEKYKFFRLSRKKNIALKIKDLPKRRIYNRLRMIEITKDENPCEMVCIYVDNEEHLYLTNDYIVTHNTTNAVATMCRVCATQLWDYETKQFVPNPNYSRNGALYIQFELDNIKELSVKLEAYISGVPSDIILDGKYTQEQSDRIDIAIDIIESSNIHLVYMPNFTKKAIDMEIKEHIMKYGIDYVVYDYVQEGSSLNAEMVSENGGVGLRSDQVISNLVDFLKGEARKYDIPIYTMTQTNGNLGMFEVLGAECIAGSRAVQNKLDNGGILLPIRPKEEKALEQIELGLHERGINIKHANYIYHMYKVRFGKFPQNIKVWINMDLGTGRVKDCFCTDWQNKLISVDKTIL